MNGERGGMPGEATRFRRTDALLDAALDLEPAARAAFVARAAADDPALRAHVERLLRAHADAPDDFLAEPGAAFAAPLLAPPALRPGASVGRHRLVRPLGEGGMAVVWLARDEALGRDVALKLVRASVAGDGGARARAEREARAVARLDHPHVAGIHEVGETDDGTLWFSMPWYAGGSLAERLRTGPLSTNDVVRIGRELVSALAAAHAQQVLHRDVKPANILLDAAGHVRLADFGIAKLTDTEATRSSGLVGTVAYLAPEQVAGDTVDHRADLWALGVTLHEMLAGARPFEGPGYAAILHAIVSRPPAPLPRGVPPALADLVARLLAKAPADRPASATEVEAELAEIAAGRGRVRRAAARGPSRRALVATVGAGAFAVVAAWGRATDAEAPSRAAGPAALAVRSVVVTGTDDPEAREAYLRGRFERAKRDPRGLANAVRAYEQAIARDPAFGRAWAGLANALTLQAVFGNAPMTAIMPRAKAMALRAIAIDSTIAEAHAALGHVLRVYDLDFPGALRASSRAMAIDPTEDSVAPLHALSLLSLGRHAEAESTIVAARRLDPANPSLDLTHGRILAATGRLAAAESAFVRTIELLETFPYAHEQLAYVHLALGRHDAARAAVRRAARLSGVRDSGHLAHILAVTGAREEARRIVAALEATDGGDRYLQPVPVAAAYAGLGERDRAFAWLGRAWRERAFGMDALAATPAFAPLHGDPRWAALLARSGVPAARAAAPPR